MIDRKDIGIILTSHPKQQMFWEEGIGSLAGWDGGPVVLCYDDITADAIPKDQFMPPVTHIAPTGVPAGDLGHVRGEFACILAGARKLKELGVPWLFKSAADTTLAKANNLTELHRLMDEAGKDMAAIKGCVHFLARTDDVLRIVERCPHTPTADFRGCAESLFGQARLDLGISEHGIRDLAWWESTLGCRHVQGEYAIDHGIGVRETWEIGTRWPTDAAPTDDKAARIRDLEAELAALKGEPTADPKDDDAWIAEAIVRGNRRLSQGDARLLLKACEATSATTLVEIGSADGCSSLVLGRWAKNHGAHLTCYEPCPRGKWKENIVDWQLQDTVTLHAVASPWVPESQLVTDIDLLFIDGNHHTRWTLCDYHFWLPHVRQGGIIVFHDWCGAGGYKAQIRRAVEIILETDKDKLDFFAENKGSDKGAVAYVKKG